MKVCFHSTFQFHDFFLIFSASEMTHEQVLSVLQNVFTVKIPKSSEWPPPDRFLNLPEASTFQSLSNFEEGNKEAKIDYDELTSDILTEVMLQVNHGVCPSNIVQAVSGDVHGITNTMTAYLMECYSRVLSEEADHKKLGPLSDALSASRNQIINFTSLVIQGNFDSNQPIPKLPFSPLHKPLLDLQLPSGFVIDLITTTYNHGWDEFKTVFGPLLQSLVMEGRSCSIVDSTYRPSLIALTELCEIKINGTSNRPICQLLSKMVKYFSICHLMHNLPLSTVSNFSNVHFASCVTSFIRRCNVWVSNQVLVT